MEKEHIVFLLKYAKKGILSEMKDLDPIESEELKQKYIQIKKYALNTNTKNEVQVSNINGEKPSAIKKWFSGIGDRQKKYQEEHKDGLV